MRGGDGVAAGAGRDLEIVECGVEYRLEVPDGGGWLLAGRTKGLLSPSAASSASHLVWEVCFCVCARVPARCVHAVFVLCLWYVCDVSVI